MSFNLKHTYTFDSFVLDVEEQVLLRDGRMVPLTPKVFETLLLLVQHQGSVVTKQTILNTLWRTPHMMAFFGKLDSKAAIRSN